MANLTYKEAKAIYIPERYSESEKENIENWDNLERALEISFELHHELEILTSRFVEVASNENRKQNKEKYEFCMDTIETLRKFNKGLAKSGGGMLEIRRNGNYPDKLRENDEHRKWIDENPNDLFADSDGVEAKGEKKEKKK